jgi:flagellar P-ring protein precursor FlgI
MLTRFSNATAVPDLSKAQNVAIVTVTAVVPSNGVRDGDHLDLRVMSIGAATSLKGGRLFVCPMKGPLPGNDKQGGGGIYALAEGPIDIEDPSTPTVGVIKGGCVMEADLPAKAIDNGRFTLILEDPSASWTTASTIAKVINGMGDSDTDIAIAVDAKNVVVTIPEAERPRPDLFISRVLQLPVLLLPTEARVLINDRTGTMIVTGDVEISPVVISHKGLTISTIEPKPVPTPRTPVVNQKDVVTLDTTQQGGAKLQDLALAFDQLKVPAEDRIAIVKELYRTGKLHAKLIVNGTEM